MKEGYINYASLHLQKKVYAKVRFCSCFKREQMTSVDSSSPQAKHAPRMHCGHTAASTHSAGRMSDCPQTLSRLKKGHSVTSCLPQAHARSSAETFNTNVAQCFHKSVRSAKILLLIAFGSFSNSIDFLTYKILQNVESLNLIQFIFPIEFIKLY